MTLIGKGLRIIAIALTPALIEQAQQLIAKNNQLEGFVAGEGSLHPVFTLISEAPGRTEIKVGHGFQGPAGKTLDDWLAYLGVTRDQIFISGTVKSRPFTLSAKGTKRDRRPTRQEQADWAPLFDYELQHVPSPLLIPLGNSGLQRLLGSKYKIGQVHGELIKAPILEWHAASQQFVPSKKIYRIIPTFHPSYIRRFPTKRAEAQADLANIKNYLQEQNLI